MYFCENPLINIIMPYENLKASLTEIEIEDLQHSISHMKDMLPFLINLTPHERRKMGAFMSRDDLFTQKAFEIAMDNSSLVPQNLDMDGWKMDIELHAHLQNMYRQLNQLMEGLSDTIMALKTEKTKTANMFFNMLRVQKDSNVPGIDAMIASLQASKAKVGRKKQPKETTSL